MKRFEKYLFISFLSLIVFFLLQQLYYYSQLPDQVAIHFSFQGEPDSWAAKPAYIGIAFFLVLMIGGGMGFSYWLIGHSGNDLINLPNKEYWLAPDLRDETIARIRTYVLLLGIETWLFLMIIMHKSMQANLNEGEVHLGPMYPELIIYLLIIAGTIIHMVYYFSRRPNSK
ncbi:MAG: DUF1648 domain-containing protein [Calditrichia bacterium]